MATYSEQTRLGGPGGQSLTIGDLFSQFKYKNTVGLQYLDRQRADIRDANIILRELDINTNDLVGIQNDTEKYGTRLIINYKETSTMMYDLLKFRDGEIFKIHNYSEKRIMIQDMSSDLKFVAVIGVPFEVPHQIVRNIMSRFGEVHDIRMNYFQTKLNGLATGTRTVKMKVLKNIPSVIIVGKKKINIAYEGQQKTCNKCGMDNHIASECDIDEGEKVNNINDTDYPVLNPVSTPTETPEKVQEEQAEKDKEVPESDIVKGKTKVNIEKPIYEDISEPEEGEPMI